MSTSKRHANVWPEMRQALHDSGWNNYSLFLQEDGTLIGYLETDDFEAAQKKMAVTEVNERWQREMGDFFVELEGDAPDTSIAPLSRDFSRRLTHTNEVRSPRRTKL